MFMKEHIMQQKILPYLVLVEVTDLGECQPLDIGEGIEVGISMAMDGALTRDCDQSTIIHRVTACYQEQNPRELIARLVEWQKNMGEFESSCWRDAERYLGIGRSGGSGVAPCEFLEAFKHRFDASCTDHADLIAHLQAEIGDRHEALSDFFLDQIANLKSSLGADAANASSDDEDDQEAAIAAAEEWVARNIPNNCAADIAVTLWLNGAEEGGQLIRDTLAAK